MAHDETTGADELDLCDELFTSGELDADEADELDSFEGLRAFSEADDDDEFADQFAGWEDDSWETN